MTPADLAREGNRLSRLLDSGIDALRQYVKEAAEAENEYRKARARAWVESKVNGGTVAEREAWVDGETADLRMTRDIADGMRRAAIEAIRARQQQTSLLQTVARAFMSEAELAR